MNNCDKYRTRNMVHDKVSKRSRYILFHKHERVNPEDYETPYLREDSKKNLTPRLHICYDDKFAFTVAAIE